jgi:tetratricopeptide (TPR) repeat protein
LVLSALSGFGIARGDDLEQARLHAQKGLAAYALGHYAQAAGEYEQSFSLHADPALLYNAAQAHRLAGNKPRALLLYKNYLRLFQNVPNRDEVERHITELEQAIESEKQAVSAPPTEPMPSEKTPLSAAAPAAKVQVTASQAPTASRADLTARAPERKRVQPWVWGVIGGAAAVALAVGLGVGLGLSSSPIDPTPSIGRAMVH